MAEHHWEYCDHCERDVVICGKCGNNCCNGGHGEIFGPEPGVMVECDACESAYEMQANGQSQQGSKP